MAKKHTDGFILSDKPVDDATWVDCVDTARSKKVRLKIRPVMTGRLYRQMQMIAVARQRKGNSFDDFEQRDLVDETLCHAVVDWEGVLAAGGKLLPCNPENVRRLFDASEEIYWQAVAAATAETEAAADVEKKSETGSNGASD